MKTFQSTPLTFIDQTDSRKLEVYIKSNLPTMQIFNQNTGTHTPDWREGEKLILSMGVFLDSRDMTAAEYSGTTIKWYKNDVEMTDGSIEDISDDKRKITIKDNILKDDAIITYTCEATYQGIVALSRITFTRVDSGLNGLDGADGTSVNIKATASSVTPIAGTDYYTITYSGSDISTAELNDAYMYNGDLYVCVDSRDGVDYFINVGRIQGPAGEPAKNIILTGSAQVFKISKTNVVTPSTISVTAHTFNTSVTSWTYSTNGGQTFLSTVPTGVSRNGNIVTITSSSITSNSIVIKASDGTVEDVFTIYKASDGTDGSDGEQGDPAPIAFLTNENVTFSANSQGQITGTTITSNVVGYNGTTKVLPTVGTITGMPDGMTISKSTITASNEIMLTITIANNSTLGSASNNMGTISVPITSPVSTVLYLTWSKVNAGPTGVGIASTTVSYGVSDASTTQPTDWQSTIPVVEDGKYLWTRTVIDYTDAAKPDTVAYTYTKQGVKGDTGSSGSSVTVSSIQYQEGTSATIPPTGTWSNSVVSVAEGKFLWTKTAFSDGKTAYGVAKQGVSGKDGIGINSITVDYGTSDSATVQPTTWQQNIPVVAEGKYLWTRTITDYTDTSKADTVAYVYTKQGIKGDTGTAGTSVTVKSIKYQAGTSATVAPTGTWSDSVVAVAEGSYLWTQTTFSDNKVAYGVAKQGNSGRGVSKITEYYLASTASSGVTTSTTGWTPTIQTIDSSKKYLWNYEVVTYTDNTTSSTNPIIIGVFGSTGATGAAGKGIESVTEYYLASASSSGVVTSTSGWTTTMQTLTATNKYLWNYELITYTDKTTSTIAPVIIGVYGDKGATGSAGADAYTVLLTNESHVFAGSTSAAIASSATTQVLAYKGTASQSVTITSVNGIAASTASTGTGIAGLSFSCSALSGTSPTITFTCTTSFVSANGIIPIVINVGGISITKMFTYSIAFKGATGGTGSVGPASSSYWLVSNASAVQKTSSGDILCTPATLTFTGRIQTGTSAPTNYAGRWILAYSTDGSTYTDSYTSTANEATASIAASSTYKAVRARMYLAGGTTTLLDEQIIPFVSDGETGAPGATGDNAVTFQVYSNNGYALSTSVPTILLQTFAYFGDVEITSGATFQWYRHNGTDWVAVSEATNAYFNVSRDDVSFSNNYMCKMQFNGTEYVGVVTIDDKNDENKVFASKPSNYFAGDLWIVGTDYAPPGYSVGTMLRAEHTNGTYTDSDWVPATKYDDEIDDLKSTIDSYKKYFSVDSTNGLQIGNSSINNDVLTIDHVETSTMDAISANIESLNVVGRYSGSTMLQAPIINLGKFSLVIESNGSLSIVVNT